MCFTRIYGFIFCDPKVINSSAIKSITRSGTTFTAKRLNDDTFTFTQQDNNTTYANYKGATTAASGTAGLVPAATTANRLKFLRGDGTWQVPTDTNTWRGIQNVLTSTSTSDSLSANMGKTLNDKINIIGTSYTNHTDTNKTVQGLSWTNIVSVTVPAGTYICFGRASAATGQIGKGFAVSITDSNMINNIYISQNVVTTGFSSTVLTFTAQTAVNVRVYTTETVTFVDASIFLARIK